MVGVGELVVVLLGVGWCDWGLRYGVVVEHGGVFRWCVVGVLFSCLVCFC